MNNQRGGIISNILMIPIGIALMIGFFFLGYYVGKYQSKSGKQDEIVLPLPEVVSKNLPKKEEFTFYKTLSDKENKTVSIDLKPGVEEPAGEKKNSDKEAGHETTSKQPKTEKQPESRTEKSNTARSKEPDGKQVTAKKETATQKSKSKLRYTLQVASYQEKQMAEDDVKKMKQRGYAAFIVASELQGKGTWYRVRLGSFSNKPAAEKLQKELQVKEEIASFITIE